MNMYTMKLKDIRAGLVKLLLIAALMLTGNTAWAQVEKTLRGRIVNQDGDPIAS